MNSLFTAPDYIEAHGYRYIREDLREDNTDAEFEAWWKIYPARNGKKVGKALAQEQYRKARKRIPAEVLASAARSYAATDFPVDAFRWLRDRKWLDEPLQGPAGPDAMLKFWADWINSDKPLFGRITGQLLTDLFKAGLVTPSRMKQRGLG